METETMGCVLVTAKIESLEDLYSARKGEIAPGQVRTIVVDDAIVDTGDSTLSLPKHMIERLGLDPVRTRTVMTAAGVAHVKTFEAVRLTIQGRDCTVDVVEIPDECPVLVGQLPLEAMDWVVDMKNHCITGNPRHGGEWITELY